MNDAMVQDLALRAKLLTDDMLRRLGRYPDAAMRPVLISNSTQVVENTYPPHRQKPSTPRIHTERAGNENSTSIPVWEVWNA